MKKLLLGLLITAASLTGFAQTFYQSDPGFTGAPELYNASTTTGNNINNSQTTTYILRVGFRNFSAAYKVPNNTIEIQIDLGNKLQLVPGFNPNTAGNLNTIFDWNATTVGSNVVLVGTQRSGASADIAALRTAVFQFEVRAKPSTTGASNIIGTILIHNTNTAERTDDNVDQNNSTSSVYNIAAALPVKWASVEATNNNCVINVKWGISEEVNVAGYQVEVSRDGASFRSAGSSVAARNASSYNASFSLTDDLKSNVVFLRVKQTDLDGKFSYSEVRAVRGTCDAQNRLVLSAYPNPVTDNSLVNVKATEGVFTGKYKLELIDNNGKAYQVKEVQVNNVVVIPFEFKTALSPGNYMIRVSNLDGSQVGTVQFVKVGGVL